MSQSDTSGIRYESAQRLLEDLLAHRGEVDEGDFDRLIAERPDLERELREIRDACVEVDRALGVARASEIAQRAETDRLLAEISADPGADGRYAIEREIGRGGMGAVFRVCDRKLDRALAMKVILGQADERPGGGTPAIGPGPLSRFLNEARITSQLDHPGIVPVHELGLDEHGRAFFTMKLVGGRTLAEIYLRRTKGDPEWSTPKVLGLIQRVCEAVAFAHERGVIHRDLKPSNVMVGDFGEVYVMDWGLARSVGSGAGATTSEDGSGADAALSTLVAETRAGNQAGTPAYMSPEQASGRIGEMGPQSDVYSIGAMLYELAAGHPPYCEPGRGSTPAEVLAHLVERPPAKLGAGAAPPELAAICERAMARSTSDRYRDVGELFRDLQAFLDGRVVEAYETGAFAEARKWVQRNRGLASALAAAVLLLVAGLTASLVFKSRADSKAVEATDQARIATQRAEDILSLSAIQDLKSLEERADALWPADPEKVPEYDAWLADARELIEGRPADPERGLKKRPSLAEHAAKLFELRARAKPLSPEQIESDRRACPQFAEWEKDRARLLWVRRMLGDEPWQSEAEIASSEAQNGSPSDPIGLNSLAWSLVDPDPVKAVYGSEVRALVLARRAVAAAGDAERSDIRDTLGWALFRCGRLDEALLEERRAGEEAEAARKAQLAVSLNQMQILVARWRDLPARREETAKLAARVAELERAVDERRTYDFESREDRWWHAQLSKLVSDLDAFRDERLGGLYTSGASEPHGWGVPKRAEFARTIRERSDDGADARKRWDDAIGSIAKSPRYGGLLLVPQVGLFPIGEDPESHLWEFSQLATGDPAERGADGKLVLKESMGLVFVLIPGGTFEMGAQSKDANGANYDERARPDEGPVHTVTLSPYFLSKYEMTQGQWERFTGRNPSAYGPANYFTEWNREGRAWTALHPVEQVTWAQCKAVMAHLGLSLPSEAQWENGARGGTHGVYWTGSDVASLGGAANVADDYGKTHGSAGWTDWDRDLDDGNTVHSEVGTYRPNPFGLHDVHGNVWEWCADGYDSVFYANSPTIDPVAPSDGRSYRVVRGGAFLLPGSNARVARRSPDTPETQFNGLGLRPARAVAR